MARRDALPPSPRQLALLRHLGYTGAVATRREASERIAALEQERRP
jgi:hypothetical protein